MPYFKNVKTVTNYCYSTYDWILVVKATKWIILPHDAAWRPVARKKPPRSFENASPFVVASKELMSD